ncbi:YeeE/YedE family protein [soil metagenome]
MSPATKSALVAFAAGIVFAIGLAVSGMTQPAKVIGFLDVTGAWDPSLALVMVGAIGVHFVARRLILRREKPIAAPSFDEPKRRDVDVPLVLGAAIFGVGWGISGYCPAPAIATLGTGSLEGIVFLVAVAGGMWAHRFVRPKVRAAIDEGIIAKAEPHAAHARADG